MLSVTLLLGLAFAGMPIVIAEEAAKKCETQCQTTALTAKGEKGSEVVAASECASCPVTAAMGDLPKISFVIAGKASTCSASAAKASKEGKEVKYVVAKEEFCCPSAAQDAHVAAVENFVASFASTHACETSGKTFVGNKGYACGQHAAGVAAVAKKAMDSVTVAYLVEDKEFCCPSAAGEAAKKEGASVTYVVAGEKTGCAKTNRMNLAVAKYKAAILAIVRNEPAEEAGAGS